MQEKKSHEKTANKPAAGAHEIVETHEATGSHEHEVV